MGLGDEKIAGNERGIDFVIKEEPSRARWKR
jgi:hypothetical protein